MLEAFLGFLNSSAFSVWGSPASWSELIGALLGLAMVVCNIRQIHWGWPLAFASSVLYCGVFAGSKLFGDAALQVFFAVAALWGWLQWLRGVRPDGSALRVQQLGAAGLGSAIAAGLALWLIFGSFLSHFTATDVPWWDGFTTGLSLVGQFLLGRKFIENWLVWIAVNVVSVGLFVHKGLWLTVALYTVFTVLSVAGYMAWRRRLQTAPALSAS